MFEQSYDLAVIIGNMRICATRAIPDLSVVFFRDLIVSRTVKMIEWAVTEQAVDLFVHLMTRIEPALFIGKKSS